MMKTQNSIETEGRTLGAIAKVYDIFSPLIGINKRFRKLTIELADIKNGDSVLDVGCGTGTLTLLAKEKVGNDGFVAGIDGAPEMMERAKRKAYREKLDVDFRAGLIEKIPFNDEQFDIVLSSLMMHHLPLEVKREGLKEILRVLKPSGRLFVVDFGNPTNILIKIIAYFFRRDKCMGENIRGELPSIIEEMGFKDVQTVLIKYGTIDFIKARKG